jgi:glycosyltransferase involved in cell wall biosynthesis
MIGGKKAIVVMPAYNAELTLEKTVAEVPSSIDEIILVDDRSTDRTAELARRLGLTTIVHEQNRGYGGNQKTCYAEALRRGADIVIMVHPDYQYTPKLIPAMAECIASGLYDVALGSRILGGRSLQGGMPLYKYVANRFLTTTENLLISEKLSEYHTGYRAFSRRVLLTLPLNENDDDFVFDNQMLVQAAYFGFRMAEITCPTLYFADASSINFKRSVKYGIGVLGTAVQFRLAKLGLHVPRFLRENGRRLDDPRSAQPGTGPGLPRRRREDFAADPVLGIAR